MDGGTLLVLLKKRFKACLRSLASQLPSQKRRQEALRRATEAAEMGVRMRNLSPVVPAEANTVGPRKPVWAVEKHLRPAGVRGEVVLREGRAKGAVQAVPQGGDQCS